MELASITRTLLDRTASAIELRSACERLYTECLQRLPPLAENDTRLRSGKAIAPASAARCILDFLRTTRLAQALHAAIASKQRSKCGSPVRVLYAGCGPIAPFALLMAHAFGKHVRIDLIEHHAEALTSAMHLLSSFGLDDRIGRSWCADATELRLPAGAKPDILFAETMQRALDNEPQLAIVSHLLPQCATDVILVPYRIRVAATLARQASEFEPTSTRERIELGTLLELSATTVPSLARTLVTGRCSLSERRLMAPRNLPDGLDLMLRTRIDAAPDLVLDDYDSGLTYPRFELALGPIKAGEILGFRYHLGSSPGFRVRRIS